MAGVDWPEIRVSPVRRVFGWAGSVCRGVVLLALVCLQVGTVHQAVETVRDERLRPAPGVLVDVGGHRLHAEVLGEGRPTVIFESGLAGTHLDWSLVAPEVARMTRVVVYDRAGMGWSEEGPLPRTSERVAAELGVLLDRLGVEGPYILVGHSLGAFHVRSFYRRHPRDVAGMVFVDGSHEEQLTRLPGMSSTRVSRFYWAEKAAEAVAHTGLMRVVADGLGGDVLPTLYDPLSREAREDLLMFFSLPKTYGTIAEEQAGWIAETADGRAAYGGPMGEVPLQVITAGRSHYSGKSPIGFTADEYHEAWLELQSELLTLSARSRQIVVKGSGHYVQIEKPEVVAKAVRTMVREARRDFARHSGPEGRARKGTFRRQAGS